jgi:hypothetical protein
MGYKWLVQETRLASTEKARGLTWSRRRSPPGLSPDLLYHAADKRRASIFIYGLIVKTVP